MGYESPIEEDKVLCGHCLDRRGYTIKSRIGVHYHPQTKEKILVDDWYAVCDECGHEIYVEYVESRNIDEFCYMCGAHDFKEFIKNKLDKQLDEQEKKTQEDNTEFFGGGLEGRIAHETNNAYEEGIFNGMFSIQDGLDTDLKNFIQERVKDNG